jgi:hypothetical protein
MNGEASVQTYVRRLPAAGVVGVGLFITGYIIRRVFRVFPADSGDVGFFWFPVFLHAVGILCGVAVAYVGIVCYRAERVAVPVGALAGLVVLFWTISIDFYNSHPDTQYVLSLGLGASLAAGIAGWSLTRVADRLSETL